MIRLKKHCKSSGSRFPNLQTTKEPRPHSTFLTLRILIVCNNQSGCSMPTDQFIFIEEQIILLLFLASLVGSVARRVRLPYTVGLVFPKTKKKLLSRLLKDVAVRESTMNDLCSIRVNLILEGQQFFLLKSND